MDIQFPNKLSLAQTPTPLQPLKRLSAELGGPNIWVKRDDMTGSVLSGNKIRKLEYIVAHAVKQGADTLITCGGIQSNHCRATALVAAQLGLKAHLILRGSEAEELDGNLLLDDLCGAEISIYSPQEYAAKLDDLFASWSNIYREQGHKPFNIPTGGSDGLGVWGYLSACAELKSDFAQHTIQPEYIICATGSAGTQAGLTLGASLLGLSAEVMGFAVCDDEAYFKTKVMADLNDWQQFHAGESLSHANNDVDLTCLSVLVNDKYIGAGYGVASMEVFETIRWAAQTEGLIFDPVYTGKAFYGLVEEVKAGAFSHCQDIVFVHTGGVFGLFPQRQSLVKTTKNGD